MLPGERFKGWIDGLAESWKDKLRGWALRTIAEGVYKGFETMEPGAIDAYRDALTKIKDNPHTPPEMKVFYEKALTPGNPVSVFAGMITILVGSVMALLGGAVPLGNLIQYDQDRLLKTYRLDPIQAITAWRRDPMKYADVFADLKDQGWDESRIEALKFFTLLYPSRQDLIRYVAREALEPDSIAKYGLLDEFDKIDLTMFEKIGVPLDTTKLDWIAHWIHPELRTIVEMLRRTDFTEADMYEWFRLVEIPPFWRQKLIDISYEVPTRVDVRRFWDMRTIDDARLREIYKWQGYHGKDLDDYVLWTKVYTAFPDLVARWKNGWITLEEVKAELTGYGMPAARVDELIETKVMAVSADRTATERDITKTDIIKGVKQGVISRSQGVELLVDMGYDEDEGDYILAINIPQDDEATVVSARQLSKTDILNGLKTAVITMDEARVMLGELRYSPPDVDFLLTIYQAQVAPPVTPRLKEASKADIVLGVKKGLITQEEGYGMLLDLDFSPEAADFILFVKTEESPFSPVNFSEFKDLTTRYKKVVGREAKPMTEELKSASAEVVRLTGDIESLQRSIETEKRGLVAEEILPEAATKRLKGLRVKLHRAEAELALAKSEYDKQVAEWRHGLP